MKKYKYFKRIIRKINMILFRNYQKKIHNNILKLESMDREQIIEEFINII